MNDNALHASLLSLTSNAEFGERRTALAAGLAAGAIKPLDALFGHFREFAAVRRREVRVHLLEKSSRAAPDDWVSHRQRIPGAILALGAAVDVLSDHVEALQPVLVPALDDVLSLAAHDGHPLRAALRDAALSLGFSAEEIRWQFDELAAIQYRPLHLLCNDGPADLRVLLSAVSVGEAGLAHAGFPRHTGDPAADERLRALIIRLREKGVTASLFLLLVVVLTAHFVAFDGNPKA